MRGKLGHGDRPSRRRFARSPRRGGAPSTAKSAHVLIADLGKGEQIGLVVDEVRQVWRLAAEEIEPANVLGGEQPAHIAGIGRPEDSGGAILILLDLRPILESP